MNKKLIRLEVGEILDTYCQDCFLKSYFRKEYGKKYAQSFCINKCTVGQKLKNYGQKLS
ncbi:zinc-finger domain-containing protein [Cytobacillus sp. S13-E01]|uniref:zinc-finger domain-containing protein n=1 Tax=Cytobacillus sp. S13-E01 TaxID=3031326 RepID=UPI0023D807EA|nr:zinc-finger domain-containing protein [Cytobacillus sp. S13-E01]MDF0727909.1 zinc-finger domain-containing protein [Cytobacillus sp. S13-E01]